MNYGSPNTKIRRYQPTSGIHLVIKPNFLLHDFFEEMHISELKREVDTLLNGTDYNGLFKKILDAKLGKING